MEDLRIENMNWVDIEHFIKSGYTNIVIGVGATEQHGPHLPLKTDAVIAERTVEIIANKIEKTLIGPIIHVGCSDHHLAFSGSVSLSSSTLQAIITDYVASLAKHGFNNIIFIPTHGGNFQPVSEVVNKLNSEYEKINVLAYTDLFGFMEPQLEVAKRENITEEEAGAHAGELESSIMMYIEPDKVNVSRLTSGYKGPLGAEQVTIILEKGMTALTSNGILGDATKANPDRGKEYLNVTSDMLINYIKSHLIE